MDYHEIEIRRSRRKTLSLEIRPDGGVLVRAPMYVPQYEIRKFVQQHENWIEKHRDTMLRRQQEEAPKEILTQEEIQSLADKALQVIPDRVAYWAPKVGVSYGRITIRNQKTKWGSCSAKGNLNFNCLLMLTPPEVIDSVVVHELCHRKYMNHSAAFYEEVRRVYPEYDLWNRWLKKNGNMIMRRMTGGGNWHEKTDSKRDPGGIFPRDRQGKTWINMEIKAVKFNNA